MLDWKANKNNAFVYLQKEKKKYVIKYSTSQNVGKYYVMVILIFKLTSKQTVGNFELNAV